MPHVPCMSPLVQLSGTGLLMWLAISACAGLCAAACTREATRLIRASSPTDRQKLRLATAGMVAVFGVSPIVWALARAL
jgi:hypothetical protein